MKKKILLAIILVATFFMCISLIFENNETYSIYRETLNTKVYLSVISSGDQIKVEFDANGGESVPDAYREYNQEIGVLPVTEQTGYNFIGWYTERDGGTKVHPSDVITAPVTYYAHWAKLVCKKAAVNTLHQETCGDNGGCTKLTGEFAYELGDPITYGTPAGTGIPVTGNAYDCDVDNNGVFDSVHERFYYIRANVGDDYQNAVLVHYTSFDAAGQMDSSSSRGSYQFEAGKAYLPDSTTWSNPALISFDTKVSRYINHTDIEEACGEPIIYNNVNYLGRCQYLLENSRFQAKASGRAGIWVDKIPGSDTLYRIQSESMSIQVPDKVTSENTVRPVIEIPFNTIDGFKERTSFNVTFDSVGGTHVPSEARYDGEEIGTLPTTTKDGLTFGGWYTDTTYQTEVTSSTVINSTTTFYAKWIKPLDDLKYLFYIPGSCTFGGSSTVNITSSTNDCISIVNPTDTAIDYTATANKYINTGVKLYITENKSKDYEIGFTLVNYDPSIQMRQATIMNTKLESTGYPGLVFRRFDETDKLDLSSRTTSSANTQLQIPSDGVEDVKIYRIYNEETEVQEIFYSINNGEKIKVNDLSQNNPTFNTDVWFGATPKDANANTAQRYFKGTLSNMYIKIKDNTITKNIVTFNANGGEADYVEKEVQQGATVGDLPNASKPGYHFEGWYTAETGGTKITSTTVVNSDITYHAHWTEKYIVSFNANSDGDDVTISQSSFEVIKNGSIGAENLPTATRDGYEFDGWYAAPDNGTQITGNEVITNDTDYYAHWIVAQDTYIVTADANGGTITSTSRWTGTGNTATKKVVYNSTYGTLPNVSKETYALAGWSLLPEGYTQVEYIESTGIQYIDLNYYLTGNTGIYADFKYNALSQQARLFGVDTSNNGNSNISYSFYINESSQWAYSYTNGAGNWISTEIAADNNRHQLYLNIDNKVILDDVYNSDISGTLTTTASSSLSLFALENGQGISRYASARIYSFKLYESGELVRYFVPCINIETEKAGLYDVINGVFYGNSGTGNFNVGESVYLTSSSIVDLATNHTIYAKWEINDTVYNITYGLNNGIVSETNPSTYTVHSNPITLNNPTKSLTFVGNPNATSGANAASGQVTIGSNTTQAQTFAGWSGTGLSSNTVNVTIPTGSTGDRSYEAHWTAVAGTLPTVTREGYVCGWSTSSTGTTIQYASGGTFPTSAITEDMAATVNLYTVCNQADYTAMIGNIGYDTVQEAINAVPENGSTPTTIVVLKDLLNQTATKSAPFAYIDNGRNIYMDLQGHTISVLSTNDNPKTIHINNGYLEVTNGTITTASTQGTVEISANGTFRVHDATIANTSAKAQAIFNSSGTVYIEDGAVLTNKTIASGNNRRAAVHNYGTGGYIYITGGTITSQNFAGVYNERGYLIIGTQGGGVSNTSPVIQGKTYGVTAVATYKFYDGIIKGETGAVAVATSAGGYAPPSTETIDTGETKISEYEANTTKINEVVGNYKVLYLQSNTSDYTITLNPSGGSIGNISNTITVTPGSEVGSLPIPTKGIYTFDGWFDEDTDEEVDDTTIPTKSTTYYAKWIYQANPNVVEFRTTPDAQKVYYQNIDTWKTSASNFPSWNSNNKESNNFALDATENTVMKNNFDNNNCMCADNQCTSSGTVHCDKPKGYNTGAGEQVNVYTYNTSTSTKETLVTYAKGSDGIIYNLIPNKVYYWELDSDITVHGLVKFIGERRILDAGDVLNARDLGGLPVDTDNDGTIDGHLKYGKLIRGIKLNSANSVTELTNLGLTKEIDLRGESDTNKLPNYQRVEAQNYYIKHNSTNTTEQQYYAMTRAAVKQIMLDITDSSDPQNVYFHCRIGTDRTGTVAYILEGLLGVPEEDRVQDYELSFFYGLIRIHRYHNEKPGSTIGTGKERFVYMHEFMPTNTDIYNWYMAGTTEEERQNDINLITAFRQAMIE